MLGLHCCTWSFSSCREWGLLSSVALGLLIVVVSLAEHRLLAHAVSVLKSQGLITYGSQALKQCKAVQASVVVACRLSYSVACGSSQTRNQTQVPCVGRQMLIYCATTLTFWRMSLCSACLYKENFNFSGLNQLFYVSQIEAGLSQVILCFS